MSTSTQKELLSLQDLGVSEKAKNTYVVDIKGQKRYSDQSCCTLTEAEQRLKCNKASGACSKNTTERNSCQCGHRYVWIALFVAGICLSVTFTHITYRNLNHEVLQLKVQLLQLQEQCDGQKQLYEFSPVSAADVGQSSEGSEHAGNRFRMGGQFREVPALPGLLQVGSAENDNPSVTVGEVKSENDGDVFDDTHDDDVEGNDRATPGIILHRFRRQAESERKTKTPGKGNKPNGGKKPNGGNRPKEDKKCKNIEKCSPKIEAAHYKTNFWNQRRKSEFGKEPCVYIPEWQGTACRNRTVRLSTHNEPLKFFEEADWMKEVYTNGRTKPLEATGGGGYNVTKGGLYLIYSSVLFHDVKPRQSLAVVVNGVKLFKCMESVDYIDRDLPPEQNQAKYKSCTMTGVTQLKKGDRLEVQNLYANTEIDLSDDATYFGVVLLTPSGHDK